MTKIARTLKAERLIELLKPHIGKEIRIYYDSNIRSNATGIVNAILKEDGSEVVAIVDEERLEEVIRHLEYEYEDINVSF